MQKQKPCIYWQSFQNQEKIISREDLINKNFRVFDIEIKSNSNLNYFTILSLLYYIKRDNKFDNIRNHLQKIITKKI